MSADVQTIQELFIQQIKDKLPPGQPLVDELAEMLNVSNDSAYRRIRGETQLAFDEIQTLAQKYGLSVDALFGSQNNAITFTYRALDQTNFGIAEYMQSILKDMQMIASFEDSQIIYAAKDIPIFHLFQVPEIAAFKTFLWMKTIAGFPQLADTKFDPAALADEQMAAMGKELVNTYMQIPSIEIWNEETITSILSQIAYYHVSGHFASKELGFVMCDKLSELVGHLRAQATHGYKFHIGREPLGTEGNFKMYVNEIVLPENTIQVSMGGNRAVYISHNVMNYLATSNPGFCDTTASTQNNLLQRSTGISATGEKDRNIFFNKVEEKIDEVRSSLG
jgi:hypothetical protein